MVLRLYGNTKSTCTKRAQVVLIELGVSYEFVPIDFAAQEHKMPEHVAVQPFGQVPYLDDDVFKLYESRAIARYIASKHRDIAALVSDPTDLQKTALFEQAASVEVTNFDPPAYGLLYELVFKPKYVGGETDFAMVTRYKKTLDDKLAVYDVILSKSAYLAGDEVTLADLFHLAYGTVLENVGVDFLSSGKYPNVTRWWNDISSRPAWKKLA